MTPGKTVGIIGLGYVGLSTAVCFASKRIKTTGLDVDRKRLSLVQRGEPPIQEEGLQPLLSQSIRRKTLSITDDYSVVVRDADIIFITVGTPGQRDGSIDLSYIQSSTRSLGRALSRTSGYKMIVVKSTVTPGTTAGTVKSIIEKESGRRLGEYGLAANPEFLSEGSALKDTFAPERIVIGTLDAKSRSSLLSLYKRFYGKRLPKTLVTTPTNAELVKYASNAFLATKVSFINEIANLCSRIPGSDVRVVAEGMGADKRIAPHFLSAGLGFGGSCLPKDLRALLKVARTLGADFPVSESALETNDEQPLKAIELARKLLGDLKGKRISVLGLSFKPGTADMREAPSIPLIRKLISSGAKVVAYDPAAIANARNIFKDRVSYASSAAECVRGADCCIIATEWPEFSKLLSKHLKGTMRNPVVVDGRRELNPTLYSGPGLRFTAIGLGTLP